MQCFAYPTLRHFSSGRRDERDLSGFDRSPPRVNVLEPVSSRRQFYESAAASPISTEYVSLFDRQVREEGKTWLPDGYSQIFRMYVFGPLGFWTMAPLRYAAKLDPFLSLDCTRGVEGVGAQ